MLPSQLLELVQDSYTHTSYSVHELEFCVHDNVVAIRGTESLSPSTLRNAWDIIRDIRVLPWKISGLPWGAAGFVKGGKAVYDLLKEQGITPTEITGHSLGGAVAVVVSQLFLNDGIVVPVTTFGAPKVFYTKSLEGVPCTMYRKGGDPVPGVFLGKHPQPVTQLGPKKWFRLRDHFLKSYKECF